MANSKIDLVFPEYLRDNEVYKHRKVTIHVMQAKSITGSVSTAIDKALAHVNTIKGALSDGPDSLDDTIKNLNKAYDKEVSGNTIFTMVLPLPNELTDTQQHDWNTAKGIFGTVLGGMENQSISTAAGGSISGAIANSGAEALPLIGAGISAGMGIEVQQALGSMSDSMGLRKPLSDPGYFQNYAGSQPRSFNMTFDFVPQNPEEAKTAIEIIMKFKQFSSPDLHVGGVSMLAPNYFDIDLSNKYISGMANIKGVVLQNIVVNYGADGSMQQYPDGTPKYMQLGLTFVERKMMHAGQYKK
jgi:hypothetical protein